jgi:hypothetical protein
MSKSRWRPPGPTACALHECRAGTPWMPPGWLLVPSGAGPAWSPAGGWGAQSGTEGTPHFSGSYTLRDQGVSKLSEPPLGSSSHSGSRKPGFLFSVFISFTDNCSFPNKLFNSFQARMRVFRIFPFCFPFNYKFCLSPTFLLVHFTMYDLVLSIFCFFAFFCLVHRSSVWPSTKS